MNKVMARRGFSLVELSIVLVILGLLVGGILAGQSLVHAAELRSVAADFNRYRTAVHVFRDKYFMLPGDITNATSIWGSAGGTGADATCNVVASTTTATCNGDGDGRTASNGSVYENFRFWQHLANAGLVEGTYTGTGASAGFASVIPGTNTPLSKLGSGVTFHAAYTASSGNATFFAQPSINAFIFSKLGGTNTTPGTYPLLPEEAWNIDTKLDDGMPGYGKIIAYKGTGTAGQAACATFAGVAPPGDAGSTYLVSNTNKDCLLYFLGPY